MAYLEKTNLMGKTALINEYSIKYHKKRLKNFFHKFNSGNKNYRSINWWLGCIQLDPMKAGKEARSLIKDLIRMGVIQKKITIAEGESLWGMMKSEDRENQYLALTILETHYPHVFVKQKKV